jgi:hypothetical protein
MPWRCVAQEKIPARVFGFLDFHETQLSFFSQPSNLFSALHYPPLRALYHDNTILFKKRVAFRYGIRRYRIHAQRP